jgi:hypothetical protein
VTAVGVHHDDFLILIVGGQRIVTTAEHPFWDVSDGAWEPAGQLSRGDELLTADGHLARVDVLETDAGAGATYDLTVAEDHTFYVGVGAVLVHNRTCGQEVMSQLAKRRLGKQYIGVPRSATPLAQGGSSATGRWWEYLDARGVVKIVVEHPDQTVHAGIPKPQSLHHEGGPPKYYDYGRFGHIGE